MTSNTKKTIRYLIISVIIIILGVGGYWYWYQTKYYPSTDDAYLHAHFIEVSPQVSGEVAQVSVHDHEQVKKGQLLYQIDPQTFRLEVEKAQATLTLAKQNVATLKANVTAAQNAVHQAQIRYENAQATAARQTKLLKHGYTNQQAAQDAVDNAKGAYAALKLTKAKLAAAQAQLGPLKIEQAQIKHAKSALKIAESNLKDTTITAACYGHLARMTLRPGDYVQAGRNNFVLICNRPWWVQANFKETNLERIHPGQSVSVSVDMYPHHAFKGRVVSIGPATGSAFSLLPPENATGNWVKVTQRIPVRILILNPSSSYPLRVGASASVSVNTRTQ